MAPHDLDREGPASGTNRDKEPVPGRERRERERRAAYLGFVAHEARNPLSTALWSSELLARIPAEERGGARGEKLAASCRRALERVRHLLDDHLLSERLETGGLALRPEAVAAEELLAAAQRRTGVTARGGFGRDLLILADRTVAERAVEGVLAAAGRGGAAVAVEGQRAGHRVLLRVRGAAPPPDALEDPTRGSTPLDRARPLALSMARRAAIAAGGRLALDGPGYLLDLPAA